MAEEQKHSGGSEKDAQENKVIAAIGYLGILCLVPLLAKKDSPYAQYHAKQGLVLFIFYIVVSVVMVIPFLGWLIGAIGWTIAVILFLVGLVNALSGRMQPLPLIGKYGESLKI